MITGIDSTTQSGQQEKQQTDKSAVHVHSNVIASMLSFSAHRETWLAMMYCLLFGVLGFTSCAGCLPDVWKRYLLSPVSFTCFASCPPTPIEYITKSI